MHRRPSHSAVKCEELLQCVLRITSGKKEAPQFVVSWFSVGYVGTEDQKLRKRLTGITTPKEKLNQFGPDLRPLNGHTIRRPRAKKRIVIIAQQLRPICRLLLTAWQGLS